MPNYSPRKTTTTASLELGRVAEEIGASHRVMNQFSSLPKGAHYLPDYITPTEHNRLLRMLDYRQWERFSGVLSKAGPRGLQMYGPTGREDVPTNGPLPKNFTGKAWFDELPFEPTSASVWDYPKGSGCEEHIDSEDFSDLIAVISLVSSVQMDFRLKDKHKDVLLEPCSLLLLSGPARYKWSHAIKARKKDKKYGIARSRRVSIVLRELLVVQ